MISTEVHMSDEQNQSIHLNKSSIIKFFEMVQLQTIPWFLQKATKFSTKNVHDYDSTTNYDFNYKRPRFQQGTTSYINQQHRYLQYHILTTNSLYLNMNQLEIYYNHSISNTNDKDFINDQQPHFVTMISTN